MKKIIFGLMTLGVAGLLLSATAQDTPGGNNPPPPPPNGDNGPGGDNNGPGNPEGGGMPQPPEEQAGTNEVAPSDDIAPAEENGVMKNAVTTRTVILPSQSKPRAAVDYTSNFLPPAEAAGTNNPDELRLNFRNAPLDMVLNYLSDAAGFIIVLDTHVNGNVNVISSHPMTRDEAVNLLNSVLNQNGYAAIRNGRTLTIVDKNDAKTRNIPVKIGNNPDDVPINAEIVTQIIPIRFVDAQKLVSDLASFVSPQATVAANTDGNSIVVTDTQSNIHHLMEIIQAIDSSAEAETEIRVFHLKYANPTDVATELGSVFPSNTSGGTQSPISFGGGRGGRGGNPFARMFGGAGGDSAGGTSSADRIKKATQVTAVADSRIQAVIVTAPKDLMDQIASMMTELDVPSTRDQKVFVFHMNNGDPQQAVQVLQNMFQTSGTSRNGSSSSSSTQNSALMQRAQNNATTTGSSSSGSSSGFGSSNTGGRGGGGGGGF